MVGKRLSENLEEGRGGEGFGVWAGRHSLCILRQTPNCFYRAALQGSFTVAKSRRASEISDAGFKRAVTSPGIES